MIGSDREYGINMYTLLHLKWVTNKVLLCNMGNSVQCYVAAWVGVELEGEWIQVYVGLSSYPPETIPRLLIGYTLI